MDVETPQDANERLAVMVDLSPTARSNVETGRYLMSFITDAADDEAVRQEAFVGIIEDLSGIGLYLSCPNEEIYINSSVTLDHFLSVLTWILPNTLYPKLRQNPKLVTAIQALLQGVSNNPLIVDYLDLLGGLDSHMGFIPDLHMACVEMVTNLRENEVFGQYLQNLVEQIQDEKALEHSVLDVDKHNEWVSYKQQMVDHSASLINLLEEKDLVTPEDAQRVRNRFQYIFYTQWAQPQWINTLILLYLTDGSTLNETDRPYYDKLLKEYQVSTKLFLLYYTVREMKPQAFEIISMMIYHWISDRTGFPAYVLSIKSLCPEYNEIIEQWYDALEDVAKGDPV